jgi:hypothetical protein
MPRGILRRLTKVRERVIREIRINREASGGNKYSRGLAGESYFGGYRDAIDDIEIALRGGYPNRSGWWDD